MGGGWTGFTTQRKTMTNVHVTSLYAGGLFLAAFLRRNPEKGREGTWACAAAPSSRQSVLLEPTMSFGTPNNSKVIASPLVPLFLFGKFMSDKRTAWYCIIFELLLKGWV